MAKHLKMTVCKHCNAQISGNAVICPSCGAKNRKPKWGLFIVLGVILLGVILLTMDGRKNRGEKFAWNDLELSEMLPEPKSNIGEIFSDSEEALSIDIHKMSKNDYREYLDQCQSAGFGIESKKSETLYSAYNEKGYELSLSYSESGKKFSINLKAPVEMGKFQWPASEIAGLLPVPKSSTGTISRESSDGFYIYVGETSMEDYNAYVQECSEKGFSVNYQKGDSYYRADNAEGYHISLSYEGNQVMSVEIQKPEDAAQDQVSGSDSTSAGESGATSSAKMSEPGSGEPKELVDGMRPEFKQAMDSYEAFYDEYCNFMEKYKKNSTDVQLIAEYSKMLSKLAEMDKKFKAWNEDEMNNVELQYYSAVNGRITQKLLEVAQ